MSSFAHDEPLTARIGVTDLRVAARPGWLLGKLSETTDMLDMARFELDAERLLGRASGCSPTASSQTLT